MTLGIHHLAVNAWHPASLAQLYATGAGFRPVDASGCWMAAPNAFLAVRPAQEPVSDRQRARRVCDPGITHFCVQSGDGQALWRAMDAAGLAFNAAPVALGTGAIYAYGRDSECNVIETEGVGDADPAAAAWIAHVALCTADLDRLTAFYERLVGRQAHHRGTYKNPLFEKITGLPDVEVRAAWIMTETMILEIWQYLNPPTIAGPPPAPGAPGYRHIGFSAADLGRESARLAASGIALASTPIEDLPAGMGIDPDGNRFAVLAEPAAGHRLSLATLSDPAAVIRRHRHLLDD